MAARRKACSGFGKIATKLRHAFGCAAIRFGSRAHHACPAVWNALSPGPIVASAASLARLEHRRSLQLPHLQVRSAPPHLASSPSSPKVKRVLLRYPYPNVLPLLCRRSRQDRPRRAAWQARRPHLSFAEAIRRLVETRAEGEEVSGADPPRSRTPGTQDGHRLSDRQLPVVNLSR